MCEAARRACSPHILLSTSSPHKVALALNPVDKAPEEVRQLMRGWTKGAQSSQSAQVLSPRR